jgi:hypothetical protein
MSLVTRIPLMFERREEQDIFSNFEGNVEKHVAPFNMLLIAISAKASFVN